tara:strand:+ start:704 stop:1165 length:462 start_codon:yes stop_codon:yes gene_type:complete
MAFNYGGGYGPGNSGIGQFQGALSRGPVDQQDLNRLIEAYKREGRSLPSNVNIPQGTSRTPIAVGLGSMGQVGNMEGMKLAHGIHASVDINGIPRYLDKGSHDPSQHNAPVDPSGNPIPELKPRDEDIPLYGMPRTLSGTTFPVGNYVNKTVS